MPTRAELGVEHEDNTDVDLSSDEIMLGAESALCDDPCFPKFRPRERRLPLLFLFPTTVQSLGSSRASGKSSSSDKPANSSHDCSLDGPVLAALCGAASGSFGPRLLRDVATVQEPLLSDLGSPLSLRSTVLTSGSGGVVAAAAGAIPSGIATASGGPSPARRQLRPESCNCEHVPKSSRTSLNCHSKRCKEAPKSEMPTHERELQPYKFKLRLSSVRGRPCASILAASSSICEQRVNSKDKLWSRERCSASLKSHSGRRCTKACLHMAAATRPRSMSFAISQPP
mmetsp:Transcript_45928/g.115728  ORF Transcript_45928/g.115728 Transcript_45928/m.115728 type:complete len:285 (+) Transcript_45928:331-1185(+)